MGSSRSTAHDPVAAFRQRSERSRSREPIPGREWRTIIGLALLVMLGPWMLGSMRMWPQVILFGISVLTFAQLFIPAHRRDEVPKQYLRRLLRFPVFWAGLLLLVFILIQAFNPSMRVGHKDIEGWTHFSSAWWLAPVKHIDWLPTSVDAPFSVGNAWRSLMNWATPLLGMCTAWVGLSRRRSVIVLFWLICLNGVVLGGVGLAQQLTGADMILWSYSSSNGEFFGTYPYRNHAGAYFYPILALSSGMYFYYMRRAHRRMQKSHPGIVFLVIGVSLALTLAACLSRGGILMGAVVLLAFVLLYFVSIIMHKSFRTLIGGIVVLLVLLVGTSYVLVGIVGVEGIEARFRSTIKEKDGNLELDRSSQMRLLMSRATSEMFLDRSAYGWGAGSYRWIFRNYQMKPEYDALWRVHYKRKGQWRFYRLGIQYAHCDILQFASETGAVGVGLITALGLSWLGLILYYIRAVSFEHVMILLGCLLALVHASFEFNLSNPSVLVLVSLLVALTVTWLRLNPRFANKGETDSL
ncbi:O-antigen ligase family protein [Ruficoccus amylovorans]|uniref:O-antigen ligase family protein n=1 Tax=Ruficoccus amylovorans TaxID=1804625 RepID=A0A842HJ39_9BACT|nr:O-antigen ligase family protein [Ruficoccus amylovorans]MBC2595624.1 O-antigen ligase family protein [Ruficoccus amylovorans]